MNSPIPPVSAFLTLLGVVASLTLAACGFVAIRAAAIQVSHLTGWDAALKAFQIPLDAMGAACFIIVAAHLVKKDLK